LRHYNTSRKVTGSIPEEVTEIFNLPNPSSSTMAVGFNQPLTAMITRKYFWEVRRADALG
jgi:hypothetical protein